MRQWRPSWLSWITVGAPRSGGHPLAIRSAVGFSLVGLFALGLIGLLGAHSREHAPVVPAEPVAAPAAVPTLAQAEPPAPPIAEPVPPTAAPAPPAAAPEPTVAPTPTITVARVQLHTVAPGETVRILAERYGVTPETVVAANDLPDPNLLLVGQQLRVPTVNGVVHTILADETLHQVAERYGVAAETITGANGLGGNPDLVASGTVLVIPGVTPPVRLPEPAPPAEAAPGPGSEAATPRQAEASAPPGDAGRLANRPAPAGPRRVSDAPPPSVSARYVAVLDGTSGQLLHGQDERTRVAPASVTKIATTLVALERAPDLGRRIPVTLSGSAMAARDGSSIMGLEPGREVSLATLLYGLMLPSGNDAAEQLAVALGGSRETYVGWMNQKVADLGLRDTHFVNPSGMDRAGHYSSAYDMALLGRAAMQHETFRKLAGAATYRGDGYSMTNLNRLIGVYPGADGIKIGFTRAAGRTIVASATHNGRRVYVSLMRSQDLPGDSTVLFDWVWRTFDW